MVGMTERPAGYSGFPFADPHPPLGKETFEKAQSTLFADELQSPTRSA